MRVSVRGFRGVVFDCWDGGGRIRSLPLDLSGLSHEKALRQ